MKEYEFKMPDGSILTKTLEVDRYHNLRKGNTGKRLAQGWTIQECASNKKERSPERRDCIFKMPDGSILTKKVHVDRYYNLGIGTTSGRLQIGWTVEECANNKKMTELSSHTFSMPDGSVLTKPADVDRYYNLVVRTTSQRLKRGWTEEDCANNKRGSKKVYTFNMPDGSVLTQPEDVDRYYNIKIKTTSTRLYNGWTEEDCANNKRSGKYTFNMPDGSVLTRTTDIDRYYNLRVDTTRARLREGWTEDECANNKRDKEIKHTFNMPDGSVLTKCRDVDRYHNLRVGTTSNRLNMLGWTEEDCANNKRGKEIEYIFNMPDGSVLTNPVDVDNYYNLRVYTTSQRLHSGWTAEECADNKRDKEVKYTFNMPDGSVLIKSSEVDKYYQLREGTTSARLSNGWSVERCADNGHGKHSRFTFNMPDGELYTSTFKVDKYYNLDRYTTLKRLREGWTEEECANNRKNTPPKYIFNMPDGSILTSPEEVDSYYNLKKSTTYLRLESGWTEEECANNRCNK